MGITFITFADKAASPCHCLRYAHPLAEALHGQVLLLHATPRAAFEPYAYDVAEEIYQPEPQAHELDAAAELALVAQELRASPAVEVPADLPSAVLRDLVSRYQPALFVLTQRYQEDPCDDRVAKRCAQLLQTTACPVLVVPLTAQAGRVPRRILIAADREPFYLAEHSLPVRQLLALPGTGLLIAHVENILEDGRGIALAAQAIQDSGLVDGLPAPEARRYEYGSYSIGLVAAVHDTHADLVIVLARQRSYFGELFHRSVTARLLQSCPVPVLVLPTAAAKPTA